MLLNIQCGFPGTSLRASSRVREVAAMFGLDANALDRHAREAQRDHRRWLIPPTTIDLPVNGSGVTFITGPSGSGKSTLLRMIGDACIERGVHVLTLDDDSADAAIVDLISPQRSLSHAMELLALAGLSDAFVVMRTPTELSDGQRFRYRVARALAAADDVRGSQGEAEPILVVIDEFAAALDRVTAKALATNIRRWSDRRNVAFALATTHDDLLDSLAPDVLIHKGLGDAIDVIAAPARSPQHPTTPIVTADEDAFVIEAGTLDDYRALAAFHYRSHHPGAATSVLRIVHRTPTVVGRWVGSAAESTLAGLLVRGLPPLNCSLRDRALGDRYATLTPHERGVAINREIRIISRVVIEPRFRGMGLAVKLVRHALEHPENERLLFTEALAAMGRISPFFERAGMTRFDHAPATRPTYERFEAALRTAGVLHDECDPASLDQRTRTLLMREARRFLRATRRLSAVTFNAMSEEALFREARMRLTMQPVYFVAHTGRTVSSRHSQVSRHSQIS